MEWTVQELAERAGISGRTLRHYHQIGLLEPDRVGSNRYRYYGADAVSRLQRILLLRDTGMPLADIAAVLNARRTPEVEIAALAGHLNFLARERAALDRRINAVEHALSMRRQGREPRMDVMLEGFNDRYEEEVVERWGRDAFDASNQWWHGKSVQQQKEWKTRADALLARWRVIQQEGHELDSTKAQEHAAVHMEWFKEIPGTPIHAGDTAKSVDMIRGLADQYETNPDFHVAFGSPEAAGFAANALRLHVRGLKPSPAHDLRG
ncbi:MerR family transcriptional regulator [Glutamicibacter nicotianae]|uniref:MerR family transcriptional regulator n=1 Tax=Glutamicibacter nicotianae TaxID=37929 RepID=UPI00195969A5|nr:DNA-binding transcriptional MerR regulator [Glutamicibacter nicotianae]